MSEQNVQVTQADHLSFRAWLSFCIEQARYNRDATDLSAAEIMTTILEQYDARHRTLAEPDLVEAADFLCDRLDEIDCSSDDPQEFLRQFYGHIPAPLSRLRMAAYRARAALSRADGEVK